VVTFLKMEENRNRRLTALKPVASQAEYKESVRQSIPLKRIPPAEDIAGPILFLASEMASYMTGEIVNVNGGNVLCG
jgi:3-oxoacyl-[acyl-carrier protein] reductase